MKISSRSWLVRYAFCLRDAPPRQTTLCRLAWQVFAVSVVGLVAAIVVAAIAHDVWMNPWAAAIGISLGVALFAVVAAVIMACRLVRRSIAGRSGRPEWVRETLYAVKQRVCPLIEIEHD